MLFRGPSPRWLNCACVALILRALFFAIEAHSATNSPEPRHTFETANRLYERGKYSDAAGEYEKLIQSQHLSVPIFFNAGNAYFQNGQLGHAVAAYRRAEMLAPRDPDVRANLAFVRNQMGRSDTRSFWREALFRLRWSEWAWLFTGATWIWFGWLAWDSWRGAKANRGGRAVAGTAWVIVALFFGFATYHRLETVEAVVMVREAAARRGPLAESQTAFTLRDGAEVRLVETREAWHKIADGPRRGWVRAEDMILLTR